MSLMHEPMVARLRRHQDLRSTLDPAISDAVSLHGGEFGNIQLRMPDGSLLMVGHTGLLSVHFAQRHRPTPIELQSIESYCRELGSRLQALLEGHDLEATGTRL